MYLTTIALMFSLGLATTESMPLEDVDEELLQVGYSAWINCTELRSLTMINIPKGTTFYEVMKKSRIVMRDTFDFEEETRGNIKHYITSLGNVPEEPKRGYYWRLYVMSEKPTSFNIPKNTDLSQQNVEDIVLEDNQYFLFWLRKNEITCDIFYSGQTE